MVGENTNTNHGVKTSSLNISITMPIYGYYWVIIWVCKIQTPYK